MEGGSGGRPEKGGEREWRRAGALFLLMLAISAIHPLVLLAVPFLGLVGVYGMGNIRTALFAALAMVVAATGGDNPLWFVERAWAIVVAGLFLAATLRWPERSFLQRGLTAVGGTAALTTLGLVWRPETWGAVDWLVRDRITSGVPTAVDALRLLQGGEPVPPSVSATLYDAVAFQADVFPATVGLASLAGLAVAWWGYGALSARPGGVLGSFRKLRFNDHLVWVFLAGLVLTFVRWGDALVRVGENILTFMGALYALRGAAVLLFLSGGLSTFGWIILGLGLAFVSPLILTGAMVIGLGDTWLDFRVRARETTE